MRLKLLKVFTLLLFTCCGLNNNYSRYELIYHATINQEEHDKILEILYKNLKNISRNESHIFKYNERNKEYVLKINLKLHSFKLDYRSNKGKNDNVELIKHQIESIKDRE